MQKLALFQSCNNYSCKNDNCAAKSSTEKKDDTKNNDRYPTSIKSVTATMFNADTKRRFGEIELVKKTEESNSYIRETEENEVNNELSFLNIEDDFDLNFEENPEKFDQTPDLPCKILENKTKCKYCISKTFLFKMMFFNLFKLMHRF